MNLKLLELRDKATFIPIFAFSARPDNEAQRYLLARSGYGTRGDSDCVILGRLECSGVARNCTYDPFAWNDRTFTVAHQYIKEHFDELENGQVIDIEFILGERDNRLMRFVSTAPALFPQPKFRTSELIPPEDI